MRRALAIAAILLAAGLGALAAAGAGGEPPLRYSIVFDNAFGLVERADFKVGGVAVGSIDSLDVERRSSRAIVHVNVTDAGFGGLRADARCTVAPQSLIGEYYVDCQPGTDARRLEPGATIGVEQTTSPIPADLVANIMRKPYRERLRIIVDELGAGLAARGGDLNATIRRALPALTETERVLEILADNRRVLQRLTRDSGRVLEVLGDRSDDVGRFVTESRDTAVASAERRDQLAETFRRFPGFLDELEPTLAALGTAAREQAPALADLRAAAPALTQLLETLPPFTRAARPALTSLGAASTIGLRATEEAQSTVRQLRRLGERSAEPANNLELVLRDLDDRDRAVEPDPDSPGGRGYTGFEAFLQYPFDQSLAINIFDRRGYLLKLNALVNECTQYTDAATAKEDLEGRTKRCSGALGPSAPGVNQPDPSPPAAAERRTAGGRTRDPQAPRPAREPTGATPDFPPLQATPTPAPLLAPPRLPEPPRLPDVGGQVGDLLDFLLAP